MHSEIRKKELQTAREAKVPPVDISIIQLHQFVFCSPLKRFSPRRARSLSQFFACRVSRLITLKAFLLLSFCLTLITWSGSARIYALPSQDILFQAPLSCPVGSEPSSVTSADFNNDGHLDLAVANNALDNLSILVGNGNATFQQAANYDVGEEPRFVITGDFNGDGYLDLVVANELSDNVSILLSNGDGTFQNAVHYEDGDGPRSVATGDFDGNGHLDLAVANHGSEWPYPSNLSILVGNGNGTFQPLANYAVGNGPRSVATGDFNGDGRVDLAVANYNS